MSSSDDELDVLQLSAEAQRALKEFYEEQNEKLLSHCDDKDATDVKFDEDWVRWLFILNCLFFNLLFVT